MAVIARAEIEIKNTFKKRKLIFYQSYNQKIPIYIFRLEN